MSPSPPARWAFLPTLGTQEGEAESPLQVSGVWRPLTKPWPRLQNWPPERMSPTTPTRRLPSPPPCPSCAVAEWIKCMGMTPPVIGSSLHLGTWQYDDVINRLYDLLFFVMMKCYDIILWMLHGNLCCNANLLLIKERYHGREEDLDESFNYFVSRPDGEWPGSPPPPMPWWMLSTWSTMTGAETQRPKRRKIPTLGTNI